MNSLFGQYQATADAKGRVMLPVALQKQLADMMKKGFVIKRSIFSKSLEIYPMKSWERIASKVNELNPFKKANVEFQRMFNYGVQQVEMDGSNRILIPKDLADYAGIKKDVFLAAANDKIEVWDKKLYEKFMKENNDRFEGLSEEVMGNIDFGNKD